MLEDTHRKAFVKGKIQFFRLAINLTYEYTKVSNTTDEIKKIFNKEGELAKKLFSSKNQ